MSICFVGLNAKLHRLEQIEKEQGKSDLHKLKASTIFDFKIADNGNINVFNRR